MLRRRLAGGSSVVRQVTTFVSRIARRATAACEAWTLVSYSNAADCYHLTCGDQQRDVPGEAFNDWAEQDDGTWRAPA